MKIKYIGNTFEGNENIGGHLTNNKIYEVTTQWPSTVFVVGDRGIEIQIDDRQIEIVNED